MKCTPLGIGFHPDICKGPDPEKSMPDGTVCTSSEYCRNWCCQKINDGSEFQQSKCSTRRTSAQTANLPPYDSAVCLGRPPRFSLPVGAPCDSTLECASGCCTSKFTRGEQVCTPLSLGFHPLLNQCVGSLFPGHHALVPTCVRVVAALRCTRRG